MVSHLLQASSLPISQVVLASPSLFHILRDPVTLLTSVFSIHSHLVPPLCVPTMVPVFLGSLHSKWLPTPPVSLTQLTSTVGSQADREGRSPGCVQQMRSAQEEDGEHDIDAQGGQNQVQDGNHSLTPTADVRHKYSLPSPKGLCCLLLPAAKPAC